METHRLATSRKEGRHREARENLDQVRRGREGFRGIRASRCRDRWVARGRVSVQAEMVARPVDTTSAGDSFNDAYIAARLDGRPCEEAAAAGNRLAAQVIQHVGAIMPRDAMPR